LREGWGIKFGTCEVRGARSFASEVNYERLITKRRAIVLFGSED